MPVNLGQDLHTGITGTYLYLQAEKSTIDDLDDVQSFLNRKDCLARLKYLGKQELVLVSAYLEIKIRASDPRVEILSKVHRHLKAEEKQEDEAQGIKESEEVASTEKEDKGSDIDSDAEKSTIDDLDDVQSFLNRKDCLARLKYLGKQELVLVSAYLEIKIRASDSRVEILSKVHRHLKAEEKQEDEAQGIKESEEVASTEKEDKGSDIDSDAEKSTIDDLDDVQSFLNRKDCLARLKYLGKQELVLVSAYLEIKIRASDSRVEILSKVHRHLKAEEKQEDEAQGIKESEEVASTEKEDKGSDIDSDAEKSTIDDLDDVQSFLNRKDCLARLKYLGKQELVLVSAYLEIKIRASDSRVEILSKVHRHLKAEEKQEDEAQGIKESEEVASTEKEDKGSDIDSDAGPKFPSMIYVSYKKSKMNPSDA
ncbi:uncharacterized protein [Procambarus clarkii]|uniref:uncharacterized protein n=1 Tax=Procambarus clarkii TaxID=6728 RepID=UPI00374308E4